MTITQCTGCGAENRLGRRFCAECGAALPIACPACAFINDAGEKFCGGCGAPLAVVPAQAKPDAKPAAAPSEADGERRPITVLFSDLSGYTKLSQEIDPEDMHALLGRYFAVVDDIVVRCGGSVDKHIGDAVMAVFGAPIAHGDDAARAVRAADMIQRAMPSLSAAVSRSLAAHIGIASGEVVASGLGSAQHRAYTVIGQSVNLASRLVDLAGPGETALDDAVHDAVKRVARCELIEHAEVRGIEGSIKAWRLVALIEAAAEMDERPFIGRGSELAQLTQALKSCAASGTGSTVVVRGDAGIGKSRLVAELRRAALAEGFACHTGLVLDFGMATGRDATHEIVAGLLGLSQASEVDARGEALSRLLAGDAWQPDDQPFLADLLGVPQPPETLALYEAMDNAARQRGRAAVLTRLLDAASRRRPVLVIVEDLHWTDRVTLDYLAAITRATSAIPAVLAMTTRLEGDPLDSAWRGSVQGAPLMTFDLGPLGPKDALALAGGMLSTSRGFAQKCVERAGGNPLFLEQLMRNADENADHLPASLHSLVLSRMDRLPELDRAALRAASVIGQRFTLPLLRTLANLPDYACDNLVAHYMIRPEGDEFLFAHALIRDGVYASLTRARRAELHRAAAAWHGDRDPALRAEHLDRAESPEAPAAYAVAARAQFAALNPERALALAERGAAIARSRSDVHALNLLHGELRRGVGEGKPAVAAYEVALAHADLPLQRCRALVGLAAGQRLIAGVDAAFTALAEAESLARAQGLSDELAEIHYIRGNLHFARSEIDDCRSQHEAAFACARSTGDPRWEARALSGLGDVDYATARMRSALERFQRAVTLFEAHAMARAAIPNRVMAGHCRSYLNEFDAAIAQVEAALTLAVRFGDRHAEMMALESIASIGACCGRFARAEPAARRGLVLTEALGARRFEAMLLAILAECAIASGRLDEARDQVERALAISPDIGPGFCEPMVLGVKLCLAENTDEATAFCANAEAILAGPCISHNHIVFRRHAIDDALRRGNWKAALRHAAALEDYTRAEPLPYCDFLIARGRVIAALASRPGDAASRSELERLRAEASHLHWPIGWPAWLDGESAASAVAG